jgi:XTP/dITP diphosphohydrolase
MKTLLFATANPHKVEEIRSLLPPEYLLKSLADLDFTEDIPETQPTIEGNAIQKAQFLCERLQMTCFAEDTGLEVEALDGAPGVLSARYAGAARDADANMNLLIQNLKNQTNRNARFKTVIAYAQPQHSEVEHFEGIVKGTIIEAPRGTQGFGYDPVFVPEGYNTTFAEMTMQEKSSISHRARALKQFLGWLEQNT